MEIKSRQEQQADKRAFWKEQVQLWQESGLSQKEYCRQNNLRDNQLTYWKKRFIRTEPVSLVELNLSGRLCPDHCSLRLNFGNQYQIEVNPGFDPVTLKQLLYMLEQG